MSLKIVAAHIKLSQLLSLKPNPEIEQIVSPSRFEFN